jgi:hypothetical protein
MPDETCRAFDSVAPFDPNALHRFVVGADPAPRNMITAEVSALGDPFASLLLARGKIPRSGEQLIDEIKDAVPSGNPLKRQSSFVLGEGSQLSATPQTAGVDRSLRFVVTLGTGPEGPDLFLSVADPKQAGGIEVMAWDRKAGGFNYYRSTGNAMWMFAGNSRDALRESSRGKGPFESHPSGALLMKELKTPWINWHSPDANIPETAFRPTDRRRTHKWFTDKEPGGGLTFETAAARPAMTRWAKERFKALRNNGGTVTRPRMILEQILDTPTVNIATTHIEHGALQPSDQLDLPATFFIDSEGLSDVVGLVPPPFLTVSGRIYARCLDKFDVRLEDGRGFRQNGDTHFCFLALERAFEDQVVLRQAIEIGLITERLAASLLMVDPWNPVFSDRRRALLSHVPAMAEIEDGKSSFSAEMARSILRAARNGPAGTPEAEFAERWKVGADFKGEFNRMLKRYYAALTAKLKTQTGFEGYFKLNEERRQRFADTMPIAEFPLLLPKTNIAPSGRRMKPDGTVTARG